LAITYNFMNMTTLKIFGDTHYFDTVHTNIQSSIEVSIDKNLIQIIGYGLGFNEKDLNKLDNLIKHYNQHDDKVITLFYKQHQYNRDSSMSPHTFSIRDFPVIPSNVTWLKEHPNSEIFLKRSRLGKILSKLEKYNFIIEGTAIEPSIQVNIERSEISISGRSLGYFPYENFFPIIIWIEDYITKGNHINKVIFSFEYFNTASSKILMDLFKILKKYSNSVTKIVWCYLDNDDDMEEAGIEFRKIVGLYEKIELLKIN